MFPNPVKRGQELFLDLAAWSGQSTQLTITSLTGQVSLRTQLTAASTPTAVRLPAQLPAGTYLLTMQNGQQKFHARMVVE
ncbi:T9SS type A sorting domain-containing protein [Hymenobacter sp. 5414T-23]|uniref:T9SS type A sorting domain-containing protein n=1 Tax=Hymenobacter sp. 5414T-23 TaxID=2932252 RepID=UPI001FD55833|nr:T9SS type A sorting domain-containing protein [Hymenobacter sp. 5414T-23]UOQ82456.1 T9SS type A sorting domain-containing protein [Hymenobacter sp. 5414T-23]